jgi:hypothetical protein
MIFNTGDKVFEIADAEPGSPAKQVASDVVVGYRCQHFGLFWLPLWTWDGDFCIYSEDKNAAEVMPPEQIALITGVPVEKIKKPFLYTFPLGLIIILCIVALVVVAKVVGRGKNQTTTAAAQFSGAQDTGAQMPGSPPPGSPPGTANG